MLDALHAEAGERGGDAADGGGYGGSCRTERVGEILCEIYGMAYFSCVRAAAA